jgi:hypothetical protein
MHTGELRKFARDLDAVECRMRQNEAAVTRIRMEILRKLGVPRPEDLTLEQQQALIAEPIERAPR